MPTTKTAAAAARMVAGAVVFVPTLAGSAALEKKVIKEKAEMDAKWLKEHKGASKRQELATNERPAAPKNT